MPVLVLRTMAVIAVPPAHTTASTLFGDVGKLLGNTHEMTDESN